MVAARDQLDAREPDHAFVEGGDGLHVEVVRRLVEDQAVRAADHHLGELAANLFTARKNIHVLHAVVAGEQHPAEEAADVGHVLHGGVAGQPLGDREVGAEFFGVVLLEVSLGGREAPLVGAFVRLKLAREDLKERRLRELLAADERDLVVVADDEGDVVEDLHAVHRLGEVLDRQDFVADLAVGAEVDPGIFAARRSHLVELDLFQRALAARRLAGLGRVRGEAGDEFLQLFDLFFLLLVRFLHLADHELARLVPEIVVAGVQRDLAVIDVRDRRADAVQEVAVVGDDDDRVLEVDEELLKPVDRVEVEVVGRLVEQQDVGIAEQGAREQHFDLLRAV